MMKIEIKKEMRSPNRVGKMNEEPTKTQQSQKNECDVNKIVAKYQKTGVLTHVNRATGSYADISSVPDYHTALQSVIDAQNQFAQLPSSLRAKLSNDPGKLIPYLNDPANREEAISLGLIDPKISPPPQQQTQTPQQQTQIQTPQNQNQTQNTPTQT